jgi:hypothetical protein
VFCLLVKLNKIKLLSHVNLEKEKKYCFIVLNLSVRGRTRFRLTLQESKCII